MIVCLDIIGVEKEEQGILIRDVIEQALQVLMPRRRNPIFIDLHIALDEDLDDAEAMIHQEEDDTFFLDKPAAQVYLQFLQLSYHKFEAHLHQYKYRKFYQCSYLSIPHHLEIVSLDSV